MRGLLALLLPAVVAGCSIGPTALRSTHLGYNLAVQQASSEELLLNLVRLRYLDGPQFLSINSISAQFSMEYSVGGSFGQSEGEPQQLAFPGVRYSDNPTITFIPRADDEFTKRLQAPIDIDSIAYLINGGWDIDTVLRLTTRSLNGIDNDLVRPSPRFTHICKHLTDLTESKAVTLGYIEVERALSDAIPAATVSGADHLEAAKSGFRLAPDGDGYRLMARRLQLVLRADQPSDEVKKLLDELNLEPGRPHYPLEAARSLLEGGLRNSLSIRTRSLFEVLFFLGQAVDVPTRHRNDGMVLESLIESLPDLTSILHVRVADSRPAGACVAVEHRGYWYYILDSDLHSKRTFLMIAALFSLQASETDPSRAPLLTLPVSR